MNFRMRILYFFFFLSFLSAELLNHSLNNFGFDLFKEINSKKDASILISPLSVSYALMMVNRGASEATSENILSTLNIENNNLNHHYALIHEYMDSYR